jgi:hypothetical protein
LIINGSSHGSKSSYHCFVYLFHHVPFWCVMSLHFLPFSINICFINVQ